MQKKIKVVHLVNDLVPAGKEIGILKLVKHLDNRVFDSSLVVFRGIIALDVNDLSEYNFVCLNKRQGNDLKLPFKLASFFNRHKPDIVHTHSWGTLVEGVLGAKMGRVPIIIHGEHGTFPQTPLHLLIQRFFWNRADVVLSVSDKLKDILSSAVGFPSERIQVILNGVEADKFYHSDELRKLFYERFNFSFGDFIVGTVGRLNSVKNQQMLIRAAAELKNGGESVHFVLIGIGERREELEELVRQLDVKKNVHFLGYQKDVNLVLNGMDVFTLTSFSEGCSNVIQEALFAGIPVIATNVGGNPELVKDGFNGYLVDSNDHKTLAQKILMLKKQPELLGKLRENALSLSHTDFSLKRMVDQYGELYMKAYQEKVLNGARYVPQG